MKARELRNWIGIYFLLITAGLGGYVLLFAETQLLPLRRSDAVAALEIIIPVLMGQLTLIFRWYATGQEAETANVSIPLPAWVVKGPPIIVLVLMSCAIIQMVLGNMAGSITWTLSPENFKAVVTFCVSLVNGTTVFIVGRYFRDPR